MTPTIKQFYLTKFKNSVFVLKIGGEVIQSKQILENILSDIAELFNAGIRVVLVHGGGSQADELTKQLGHTPQKIEGRRVTTAQDLEVVKMLYGGSLNLEILSIMKKVGIKGVRTSGMDGDLLTVKLRSKDQVDYGFVGDIERVNNHILHSLLDNNYLPVISPIAATEDGTIVNINADTIATQIAISMKAEKLILFTSIDGVYNKDQLLSDITCQQAQDLIDNKIAQGGMSVKLQNCIEAAQNNVKRVHIINGLSPHSLLMEVLSAKGVGTMIVDDSEQQTYIEEQNIAVAQSLT
jgi:acetylglutamate kinase